MGYIYEQAKDFKRRYRKTIAWRLKKNSRIVEKHLNSDEEIKYVFVAQKNDKFYDLCSTAVLVMTDKRLLIGRKRLVFGYFFDAITPDMFNDMNVYGGIIWGKVNIDTIKEVVVLTNIDKKALPEIETNVTSCMMRAKEKYCNNLSR